MENLHTQGYDSVVTRRKNREGKPPIRSWFARRFYRIINKISDADIVDGARDFRLMKREMVEAIVSMTEYNRFLKGMFGVIGQYISKMYLETKQRPHFIVSETNDEEAVKIK